MMSPPSIEFLYLTVRPDIRPEDPDSEGGRSFTSMQTAVEHGGGLKHSRWGRTLENENNIVWIIEWADHSGCVPLSLLNPILEPESIPVSFHVTLTPSLENIFEDKPDTSPVIELAALAFPDNFEPTVKANLNHDLVNFRTALLHLRESKPPDSFSMGWVERPSTVKHPDSESGQASLVIMVVGWESKEDHMAASKTEEFERAIGPLKRTMLPALQVLEMRHVKLRGGKYQE
ncbi:hypothetical protein FQN57_002649 [Myotisia sp. PD_48]|nr:hypothetical protein FQN57_002649 [Myotisia sp. PD_48]